ncbi:MAG: DNA topoisomerase (ATP-hydrolyzing) subunit B [Candidatus Paceibacterota bacterium]
MAKKPKKITENQPSDDNKEVSYKAKDIYVLEGLAPVRKRPGMYIGTTGVDGLQHLIHECVDNAIDEAMAGFAKNIKVELLKNNQVAVTDDGRGIPVDIHPQTKKSALETVMTTLHAGGKFGGESYKVAGGLHGVGVSVVNALSKWLRVEVCRDGNLYAQEYERGEPKYKVKKEGKCELTGTKVIFDADPQIFSKIEFDRKKILDHLRQQAFLTKGIKIEIIDEREVVPFYHAFHFEGGLLSFIEYLNRFNQPVQKEIFYAHKNYENIEVESAFIYNQEIETHELSFANNIYTADGGTHITGFRSALTRTLNDYARANNYLKESDDNLTGDDVREGLVAIVSVKLREPQFEGQTKARLGNPEARTAVETVINESLKEFLEKHSNDARAVIEKCLLAAKARKAAKAAKDTVLRKGILEGLTLPGKLADCSSRDPSESELFVVEGDSAGGCFSGNTKIALADGRNLTFKKLVEEYKKDKKNYCYTIKKDGSVGVGEIKNPRITKKSVEVIKIILDNNEEIICTPEHKFMLRNGSYKMAKDLKSDNSLMPFRRQYPEIGGRITIKGYELVFSPRINKWIFTHLLSDEHNLEKDIYSKNDGDTIHHLDFNKLNNNPHNLIRMPKMEHLEYHTKYLEKTLHREDVKEKSRKIHQSKEYREKIRKIMTTPKMRKLLSDRAKKQWQNEEYKNYMTQKFLEFYRNNSEYREKNNKHLNEAQKLYWGNIENKNKQAKRVKNYFEKYPEKREWLSMIAKKQWSDLDLLKWRSQTTKKQWTLEFREKRIKAYNQTYLRKALEVLYNIYQETNLINKKTYNQIRKSKNDKSLIKYDTICQRFFDGNEEKLKEAVLNYNHRIKAVIQLKERIDVYDIEVPGTHNFALASGVFVHNSSKMARDRRTQAILPLRGKPLNVERARVDKMLANKEIRSLVIAIGTAIGQEFDISKLRYHKIILMTDADVDGSHIRTLLLTLFYRHFVSVIENGYLYIAQPPLYRIQSGKDVKYAYTEPEKEKIIKEISKARSAISIQRYKGLGEMNPDQLWETTMDPEKRMLKIVTIEDAQEADKMFDVLMGEQVEPRRHFIQSRAAMVKNLDI